MGAAFEPLLSVSIRWEYTDGGRAAAGFKGRAGDCATRAIAIATGDDYSAVYKQINTIAARHPARGSSARTGVHAVIMHEYLQAIGWGWVATMKVGSGCRVHLTEADLPSGRLIARLSKHYAAVIDKVLFDTHDSSRDGKRCVYGYWAPVTRSA
jgi:hypothetical protein